MNTCPIAMEYAVEGETIDPATLQEPGWRDIRRRATASASQAQRSTAPKQQAVRKNQKPTPPPQDPLPDDDIKVVLRPQGGLDLSKQNTTLLADAIFQQSKVPLSNHDQLRTHHRANFVIISTPSESRAQQYLEMTQLQWNGVIYPLANHIPPPSSTIVGALFQVPPSDDDATIMTSLTKYNNPYNILEAKRIRNTNIVQILFAGDRVPFWLHYRSTIMRCYPFKRKSEACYACWQAGHRRDVCPHPSPKPHCPSCGLLDPPPQHPCDPKCILCGGPHLTGVVGCEKRFQPPRKPAHRPTLFPVLDTVDATIRAAQAQKQAISQDAHRPPKGPATYSQVVRGQVSSKGLLPTPPPPILPPNSSQPPPPWHIQTQNMLKEIQDLRSQLLHTKLENERLARENALLKAQVATPTSLPIAPQAEPPLKRKAVTQTTPTPPAPEIESLRIEIGNAFTSLQKQTQDEITVIKHTVQDLHNELLKWATQFLPAQPPTPEIAPLAASIDHDTEL